MSNEDIIRAWKDETYRNSLSAEQKAQLPEDPAGIVDVTDEEFSEVMGGRCPYPVTRFVCGSFHVCKVTIYCPRLTKVFGC